MPLVNTRHARQIADNPDLHALRDGGASLAEIGQVLGVSKERDRQIEDAASVKCTRWCERHGYRLE